MKFICQIPAPEVMKSYGNSYKDTIIDIAQRAEKHGFHGILIYYGHNTLDVWATTQLIFENTTTIQPLVAAMPQMLSPLALFKKIQTLSAFYHRKVALNFIIGSRPNELQQTGHNIDKRTRYSYLDEYIRATNLLLGSDGRNINFDGKEFKFSNLRVSPALEPIYKPDIFVASGSPDGYEIVRRYASRLVLRPEPVDQFSKYTQLFNEESVSFCIKIGIIAQESSEKAWTIARERFKQEQKGRLTNLLRNNSDDTTHIRLNLLRDHSLLYDEVYWMGAYSSGVTNDPYLVGSYMQVAEYLYRYKLLGADCVIVNDTVLEQDFESLNQLRIIMEALDRGSYGD